MRDSASIEVNQLHVSKSLSSSSIIFQVSHMLYPKYAVAPELFKLSCEMPNLYQYFRHFYALMNPSGNTVSRPVVVGGWKLIHLM